MVYLTHEIGRTCFTIARYIAPIDTGNLRHNAMILIFNKNGFEIIYDDGFAPYIDFLEMAGIGSSDMHQGFIEIDTFDALVGFLEYTLNGSDLHRAYGALADRALSMEFIQGTSARRSVDYLVRIADQTEMEWA